MPEEDRSLEISSEEEEVLPGAEETTADDETGGSEGQDQETDDTDPLAGITAEQVHSGEVDLDELNDKLENQPAESDKTQEPAALEAEAGADDGDPVIEKIVHNGQEVGIRRSQMTKLLQQGYNYETKIGPHAEAAAMIKDDPNVAAVVHALRARPELISQFAGIVTGDAPAGKPAAGEAPETGAFPEVEGVDPDDVSLVFKAMQAIDKQKEDAQSVETQRIVADKNVRAQNIVQTLQATDTLFPQVKQHIDWLFDNDPMLADPNSQLRQALADPDAIDPSTGRPYIMTLYSDVRKQLVTKNGKAAPAGGETPAPAVKPRTAVRLDGGGSPAPAGSDVDYSKMSDEMFAKTQRHLSDSG